MARSGVVGVAPLIDRIETASVDGAEDLLRRAGVAHAPVVHMLCDDQDQPYIGYVTCRPFRCGRDAADAVGVLGMLPFVLAVTHVVVVWEYADLCAALELPGPPYTTGLAVVEASLTEHVVRWHPFRLRTEPADIAGSTRASVEWGSSSRRPGGRLPVPVADLLAVWRRPVDGELGSVVAMMERAGYRIRWAARS